MLCFTALYFTTYCEDAMRLNYYYLLSIRHVQISLCDTVTRNALMPESIAQMLSFVTKATVL